MSTALAHSFQDILKMFDTLKQSYLDKKCLPTFRTFRRNLLLLEVKAAKLHLYEAVGKTDLGAVARYASLLVDLAKKERGLDVKVRLPDAFFPQVTKEDEEKLAEPRTAIADTQKKLTAASQQLKNLMAITKQLTEVCGEALGPVEKKVSAVEQKKKRLSSELERHRACYDECNRKQTLITALKKHDFAKVTSLARKWQGIESLPPQSPSRRETAPPEKPGETPKTKKMLMGTIPHRNLPPRQSQQSLGKKLATATKK